MRRAITAHRRDFVAILALVAIALAIAAYILYHQPSFTFGQSYYSVRAEFATSAAVTPGRDRRSRSPAFRSGWSEAFSSRTDGRS